MNDETFKNRVEEIKEEYIDKAYKDEDSETAEAIEAYLRDFVDDIINLY